MDAKVEARPAAASGAAAPSRIQSHNRALILEAALAVFAAHGFRGSTLDEIARRAGMSKPNVLYYFRRKQDIYAAVLEGTLGEWLAPLEALDAAGDPVEELRRYIAAKLAMSAERPAASRLFVGEILAGAPVIGRFLETRLRDLVHAKAAIVRGWIDEKRLAPVDPMHLIFAIWATTQHYADFDVQIRAVLGAQVDEEGFHAQTAQSVLAIVLDGVRPR